MPRTIVLALAALLLASCSSPEEDRRQRKGVDRHSLEIAKDWAPPNATHVVAHGDDWEEFDVEVSGVGNVHVLASTCDGKLDWQAFRTEVPKP